MKRVLLVPLLSVAFACTHQSQTVLPPPTTATLGTTNTTAASDPPPKPAPDTSVVASKKLPELTTAPAGADDFTRALFGQLKKAQKGNFALAGGNVRDALIAVALGAKGKTKDEMVKALALADVAEDSKRERAGWISAMGEAQLVSASRLWFDATHPLAADYLGQAKDALSAEPQAVDFLHKADAARTTINDWAKEQTGGKITELLAGGSVDPRTRLVATSALYFKAPWTTPFSSDLTKADPFFVGKAKKEVPTMHRRGQIRASVQADRIAVDLPYGKSGISMLVVATRDANGSTAALEDAYVTKGLAALQEGLSLADSNLALPKFTFRSGGSLVGPLKALGLKDAFGATADLSGLFGPAGKEPLFLSDVVQRTFIAVDEKGTEAAAASAATVSVRSAAIGQPLAVTIDHAFLFFLHDAQGRVLFAGRVADPTVAP